MRESQNSGRRRSLGFMLLLFAAALAGVAQAHASSHGWWSVAGFLTAMLLFAIGDHVAGAAQCEKSDIHVAQPLELPQTLLRLAFSLCLAAAAGEFFGFDPVLTHSLWLIGLLVFAGVAIRHARRERSSPEGERRPAWPALALLGVLCIALYGWELSKLPVEVHGDDAEVGNDAIELIEQRPIDLFRTGWYELPMFHAVPTAVGLLLFGINLTGLRATSAALGTFTVLLWFCTVRRLWNVRLAWIAALLLATSRYFVHLSRAGYHYIDTPLLSVLALWLFARMWQSWRTSAALWCGIALGLGVQTYYASRLVPMLLAATWLMWMRGENERVHKRWALFAVVVLTALATAAPMIAHFAHNWGDLWARTRETSLFDPINREHVTAAYRTQSLAVIALEQLGRTLAMFNARPDTSVQYGFWQPLLEPVGGVLFVLGVGSVIARLRDRRNQLVLLWTIVPLILGVALTIDAPFYPRMSGIMPFVALIIAFALDTFLRPLHALVPTLRGALVFLAAAGVLGASVYLNLRSYFVEYAPVWRHSPAIDLSRFIIENGTGRTTYMIAGSEPSFYITHGAVRFLTHKFEKAMVVDLERFLSGKIDPDRSAFLITRDQSDAINKLRKTFGRPLRVIEIETPNGEFFGVIPRPSTGEG